MPTSEPQLILDCLAVGVVAVDNSGDLLYANSAAEQILGEPDGVSAHDWVAQMRLFETDTNTPLRREENPLRRALLGESVNSTQLYVRRDRDDGIWVEMDASPMRGPGGDAVGAVAAIRDITVQKLLMDALSESEERHRKIVENATEGIWQVDADFRATFVSPSLCRMTGCAAKELLGRHVLDLIVEEDLKKFVYQSERRKQGESGRYEVRLVTKEGGWFHAQVSAAPIFDKNGCFSGALAMLTDITGLRVAEAAMHESEERFRMMFEAGPIGMVVADADTRILRVNHAFRRMFGYGESELVGSTMFDLTHPDDRTRSQGAISSLYSGETAIWRTEKRYIKKDGEVIWADSAVAVVRDPSGEPLYGVGVIQDITQRKAAALALAEAEKELRVSHKRLRDLAAYRESVRERERTRIAREIHDELGQMLTVLKMELENLASGYLADCGCLPEVKRRVDGMSQHLEASLESVKRIAADLRPGLLDHLGLVAAIEWQAQEFQRRTGIRCMIQELPQTLDLPASKSTAVFRIFQEVLTNVARHAKASTVRVRLAASPRRLRLEVRDNGVGIPQERLTAPASLGLLGMRERSLSLGGSIKFKGIQGRGTTVILQLPIRQRSSSLGQMTPERAPANRKVKADGKGPAILLADDHEVFRRGLKKLLVRAFRGAKIGEASDGEEALRLLEERAWDLLVLDISMPRKSGVAVLKHLRSSEATLPVLVVSSHPENQFRHQVLKAGAAAYMSKDRPSAELVRAVRDLLRI